LSSDPSAPASTHTNESGARIDAFLHSIGSMYYRNHASLSKDAAAAGPAAEVWVAADYDKLEVRKPAASQRGRSGRPFTCRIALCFCEVSLHVGLCICRVLLSVPSSLHVCSCICLYRVQYPTLDLWLSPLRKPHVLDNWCPREIALFEAGICAVGKDFHAIARLLQTKSCKECVDFYYVSSRHSRTQQTGHCSSSLTPSACGNSSAFAQ
jgi:hypothetical protein